MWTSVDEYKNAKDARKGLARWKVDDAQARDLANGGLSVTHARIKVPKVGSARFGDLTRYSDSNIEPVSSFDEWFTDGRYLLDVRVAANSPAQAWALATKFAKKLDRRLHLALEGRLHGKAAKLPPKPKKRPAAGGPDLREVWTSVDEYKSARDAKRGVAFWKKDDALFTELNQGGLSVTNGLFKVPKLGSARFGDLTNYSASNIANLATFDEEVADGRYVLDVTVSAGIASEA